MEPLQSGRSCSYVTYRHSRKSDTVSATHPTRQRLIETAAELIGEVGLDAVEMTSLMQRVRYVAIASSSESMRQVIAQRQQEMTAQMTAALKLVDERGWLRTDLSPKAVAVFVQAFTLGRIVDDITDDPVDPEDWINLISTVMIHVLSSD